MQSVYSCSPILVLRGSAVKDHQHFGRTSRPLYAARPGCGEESLRSTGYFVSFDTLGIGDSDAMSSCSFCSERFARSLLHSAKARIRFKRILWQKCDGGFMEASWKMRVIRALGPLWFVGRVFQCWCPNETTCGSNRWHRGEGERFAALSRKSTKRPITARLRFA